MGSGKEKKVQRSPLPGSYRPQALPVLPDYTPQGSGGYNAHASLSKKQGSVSPP